MSYDIETIWNNLERDYSFDGEGLYRRLDLDRENGIRIAILAPGKVRAIMVELWPSDNELTLVPPAWKGMGFKTVPLEGLKSQMENLCLFVENQEHRAVFTSLCLDIIRTLESSDELSRARNLQVCFNRWSKFFEKCGMGGLSLERRRGLFGELYLLADILRSGYPNLEGVLSWKGCLGSDHDFIVNEIAIEVKTTISKEPRKVIVNNERQLDANGLESLYLYIMTLSPVDGSEQTLQWLVGVIRDLLDGDSNALFEFENGLIASGYRDADAARYTEGYIVRMIEAFKVREGFPRIISLPSGVGDLEYSLTISACQPFSISPDAMLSKFTGRE